MEFSKVVRDNPISRSPAAMEFLQIGMNRLLSVLDREEVSTIRTLEMKISDAGPKMQRVEPHILGLAGAELIERGRIKLHRHHLTGTHKWYAPSRFKEDQVFKKLNNLALTYNKTVDSSFTAALGDPLEISIFKVLLKLRKKDRRITFQGSFDLSERMSSGRFQKIEPPVAYNDIVLDGPPDFTYFTLELGDHFMIECKNHREWIYTTTNIIKTLVRKAILADMTPILIARRLPYITKSGLCAPAGIIVHETYNQLYPEPVAGQKLAALVRETHGLGYADVRASEETLDRTIKFFEKDLQNIASRASDKFQSNKSILSSWVEGTIFWKELFKHINKKINMME